jgi:type II secretory pathway component PulC
MIGVGLQSECGIRSEDVIVAINGIPVADRVVLAENREKLTAASELALELERNGQKRLITYFVSE